MTYSSAWGSGAPYSGSGGEWASRPRYTPADFITLMWRDRFLILGVFLTLFLIGVAAALMMKTQYPAHSSVLVRLGQEYVYEPNIGDAGRGPDRCRNRSAAPPRCRARRRPSSCRPWR